MLRLTSRITTGAMTVSTATDSLLAPCADRLQSPLRFRSRQRCFFAAAFLLIACVSVTTHTLLPLPPPVILFVLGTVLAGPRLVSFKLDLPGYLILLSTVYCLATQPSLGVEPKRLLGFVLAPLFYIIANATLQHMQTRAVDKISNLFINISLLMFMGEAAVRFLCPGFVPTDEIVAQHAFSQESFQWIYQYKENSIMYCDSNIVAIHVLVVLFFLCSIRSKVRIPLFRTKFCLLSGLLLLTFSRAGWLAWLIGIIWVKCFANSRSPFTTIVVLTATVYGTLKAVPIVADLISTDGSYLSKIHIFEMVLEYLRYADYTSLFFGIGLNESTTLFGRHAHNYFLVLLVETGVIGLVLYSLLFLSFLSANKRELLAILVPFLVAMQAATITFMPFLFVAVALVKRFPAREDGPSNQHPYSSNPRLRENVRRLRGEHPGLGPQIRY